MASVRCAACKRLYFVTMTHPRERAEEAVLKSVLECSCGESTTFELLRSDSVHTPLPLLEARRPRNCESVDGLYRDAEAAFWIGAFGASLAGVRTALELCLRHSGLDARDLTDLTKDAEELGLIDQGMGIRMASAGIVPGGREDFATPLLRHQALSALQIGSIALMQLARSFSKAHSRSSR